MNSSTFTARQRARRIPPALVIAFTIFSMLAFFFPLGVTPAEADPEEKCTTYYFEYDDGHVDSGEVCDGPVNELYQGTHGIHVPNLHISCSDEFNTPVTNEEGEVIGYTSEAGQSDLGSHYIVVEDGVAQWGISKSWTGDRVDCGFFVPEPEPEPECEGTVMVEVRDATSGELVTVDGGESTVEGSGLDLEADGTTDVPGTFDCDEVSGTLDVAPTGYDIVDGSDSATIDEDGEQVTLVFTVTQTPPPPAEEECEGPVEIEVRHADTGELVTGDADGTFDGSDIDLDADGETDAGTFDCDTDHTATLTTPPAGYVIVDGEDAGTLTDADEDGDAELLTLVLTVDDAPAVVEECEGALEIVVIGPDGNVIDGPVELNNVEITTTFDDNSVECDQYTVFLDEDALPEGVSLATVTNTDDADATGPVQIVTVNDGDEDRVVFELVQVEGVTIDRPDAPAQPAPDAPDAPDDQPAPETEGEELARTGVRVEWLLMLAVIAMLGGIAFLRIADSREQAQA